MVEAGRPLDPQHGRESYEAEARKTERQRQHGSVKQVPDNAASYRARAGRHEADDGGREAGIMALRLHGERVEIRRHEAEQEEQRAHKHQEEWQRRQTGCRSHREQDR